jgi:predicted small lipoprotein YifL
MKNAAVTVSVFFLCALLALAACGKKGDPEPPKPDKFPVQYPAAQNIPETGNTGQTPAAPAPQPPVYDPLRPIYP